MTYQKSIEGTSLLAFLTILLIYSTINFALQAAPTLKADQAKFDLSKSKPIKGKVAAYKPLQGSVKLSVTLPPVPADLHKGAIFKKENIPKTPKVTDWYLIPSWMTGEWHRETVTDIAPFPLDLIQRITGSENTWIERADHLWGHQVDRLGGIWHHRVEPFTQFVEQEQLTSTKTITLLEPVLISDSKVIMHYKDISVDFDKTTHRIVKTYQREQISEISRLGNLLIEDVKSKNFDDNGRCFAEDHVKTSYTSIRPFHPIDIDKRTKSNLREDFKLYLKVHGYIDRIPGPLPKSQ